MPQNLIIMKTNLWSSAAVNGFLLALITIIFTLFQTAFPMGSVAASILIWVVKLGATTGTLYYFVKTIGQEQEYFPYKQAFTYGFVLSFCSNIVIACYLWLHYTFIFPNAIEKQLEVMQPMLAQYNTDQSAIDAVLNNLPVVMTFSTLLLYSLFALIVSAIIASFVKKAEDPFAGEPEL